MDNKDRTVFIFLQLLFSIYIAGILSYTQVAIINLENQIMGSCLSKDHSHERNEENATKKIDKGNDLVLNDQKQSLIHDSPIIKPNLHKAIINPLSNQQLKGMITVVVNQFLDVKVPKDFNAWTQYHWIKEPLYLIPENIRYQQKQMITKRSFQQKLKWFRIQLEKSRVAWDSTSSEYLVVDRQNILMSSFSQFGNINFFKEVKIIFKGQEETNDAGGVLRQWMNLCIKEIFEPELGLFKLCDTTETFYKFHYNEEVMQLFEVSTQILGVIIGKAIFQRIPLFCPLNYTIIRQLCNQNIQMNDIYTYDKDYYNGWSFIANNDMVSSLEQNFCVYQINDLGEQIQIPLKDHGQQTMLNSQNKQEYLQLTIQYYCTMSVKLLIDNLKKGLYKIINPNLLSIFQPHELDMIINGQTYIDFKDLQQNTIYSGYQITDNVIIWFWNFVSKLSQEKLSCLLHFVTGNGRVPILGFKYLQSNRGQFQKFHIKSVPYDPINPYPKSHTCFNRLQLLIYPNISTFNKYIEYVIVQMDHFGLQ